MSTPHIEILPESLPPENQETQEMLRRFNQELQQKIGMAQPSMVACFEEAMQAGYELGKKVREDVIPGTALLDAHAYFASQEYLQALVEPLSKEQQENAGAWLSAQFWKAIQKGYEIGHGVSTVETHRIKRMPETTVSPDEEGSR